MESTEEQIRQTSAKNGSFVVDPCPSGKGFPPKPVALCLIYTRHWVRAEGLKFSYSKGAIRMLKTEGKKNLSLFWSLCLTITHILLGDKVHLSAFCSFPDVYPGLCPPAEGTLFQRTWFHNTFPILGNTFQIIYLLFCFTLLSHFVTH